MDTLNVNDNINLSTVMKSNILSENKTNINENLSDNDEIIETFRDIGTTLNYGAISYVDSLYKLYNEEEPDKLVRDLSIQKEVLPLSKLYTRTGIPIFK